MRAGPAPCFPARRFTMTFDTLKLYKSLRDKAHFTPEQAEDLASSLAEVIFDEMVTRAYLSKELELVEHRACLREWSSLCFRL